MKLLTSVASTIKWRNIASQFAMHARRNLLSIVVLCEKRCHEAGAVKGKQDASVEGWRDTSSTESCHRQDTIGRSVIFEYHELVFTHTWTATRPHFSQVIYCRANKHHVSFVTSPKAFSTYGQYFCECFWWCASYPRHFSSLRDDSCEKCGLEVDFILFHFFPQVFSADTQ